MQKCLVYSPIPDREPDAPVYIGESISLSRVAIMSSRVMRWFAFLPVVILLPAASPAQSSDTVQTNGVEAHAERIANAIQSAISRAHDGG